MRLAFVAQRENSQKWAPTGDRVDQNNYNDYYVNNNYISSDSNWKEIRDCSQSLKKKIFTIFDELFLETFPKYSAYFCQTLLFDNSENTALQTRPYPLYIAASKKVTPSLSTTTVPTKGKKREDTWASTPSRKTTTPSTPSRTTTEQQKPNAPYYESFMYEYIQKPKQYEYETFAYEYFNTKQRHSKKTRQASLDNQTYLAYLLKLFW